MNIDWSTEPERSYTDWGLPKPGQGLIAACACGWIGLAGDQVANPSGGMCCPNCGASGGLLYGEEARRAINDRTIGEMATATAKLDDDSGV